MPDFKDPFGKPEFKNPWDKGGSQLKRGPRDKKFFIDLSKGSEGKAQERSPLDYLSKIDKLFEDFFWGLPQDLGARPHKPATCRLSCMLKIPGYLDSLPFFTGEQEDEDAHAEPSQEPKQGPYAELLKPLKPIDAWRAQAFGPDPLRSEDVKWGGEAWEIRDPTDWRTPTKIPGLDHLRDEDTDAWRARALSLGYLREEDIDTDIALRAKALGIELEPRPSAKRLGMDYKPVRREEPPSILESYIQELNKSNYILEKPTELKPLEPTAQVSIDAAVKIAEGSIVSTAMTLVQHPAFIESEAIAVAQSMQAMQGEEVKTLYADAEEIARQRYATSVDYLAIMASLEVFSGLGAIEPAKLRPRTLKDVEEECSTSKFIISDEEPPGERTKTKQYNGQRDIRLDLVWQVLELSDAVRDAYVTSVAKRAREIVQGDR